MGSKSNHSPRNEQLCVRNEGKHIIKMRTSGRIWKSSITKQNICLLLLSSWNESGRIKETRTFQLTIIGLVCRKNDNTFWKKIICGWNKVTVNRNTHSNYVRSRSGKRFVIVDLKLCVLFSVYVQRLRFPLTKSNLYLHWNSDHKKRRTHNRKWFDDREPNREKWQFMGKRKSDSENGSETWHNTHIYHGNLRVSPNKSLVIYWKRHTKIVHLFDMCTRNLCYPLLRSLLFISPNVKYVWWRVCAAASSSKLVSKHTNAHQCLYFLCMECSFK